ncbi:MAG TPA: DUF2934 domain-containing protein [Nitrospirales bacterium]
MGNLRPEARENIIRKKAHELWEQKGRRPGHALDDWLEAEKIIDAEQKVRRSVDPVEDREVPIVILDSDTTSRFRSGSKRV